MATQRTQAEVLTNEVREAVVSSLLLAGANVHYMGVHPSQEDWGAALIVGMLESLGVVLAEAFKHEHDRLPHIYPRCEEILKRTVEHVWTTNHVPGCDCSEQP